MAARLNDKRRIIQECLEPLDEYSRGKVLTCLKPRAREIVLYRMGFKTGTPVTKEQTRRLLEYGGHYHFEREELAAYEKLKNHLGLTWDEAEH